jgi:hypothetical protein
MREAPLAMSSRKGDSLEQGNKNGAPATKQFAIIVLFVLLIEDSPQSSPKTKT